jgi:hypothetical protein
LEPVGLWSSIAKIDPGGVDFLLYPQDFAADDSKVRQAPRLKLAEQAFVI